MRYAALDGGKRLRPFLGIQGASLFNVSERGALRVAAALEMVHCYTVIHDELPAMDDDDQSSGKPTVHRKDDEEGGILDGEAGLRAGEWEGRRGGKGGGGEWRNGGSGDH